MKFLRSSLLMSACPRHDDTSDYCLTQSGVHYFGGFLKKMMECNVKHNRIGLVTNINDTIMCTSCFLIVKTNVQIVRMHTTLNHGLLCGDLPTSELYCIS